MISKKCKGLFVEANAFTYQVAACSALSPPFVIESITEIPVQEPGRLRELLGITGGATGGVRYVDAHCGVVPESRFFRMHTLDSVNKAKDPQYFIDLLENQYRMDPGKVRASALSASTGAAFNPALPLGVQKELLICGAENEEFDRLQDQLLECGIYPRSLQLSPLAAMGSLMEYLRYREDGQHVLLVELSPTGSHLFILNRGQVALCRSVNFGLYSVLPIIQQQLGLQDEESAKSLFFANTFDFREIGAQLLQKLIRELQAAVGFYEVQTGQSVSRITVSQLPQNLSWMGEVLAGELEMELLGLDWKSWLERLRVQLGEDVSLEEFGAQLFSLAGLFGTFSGKQDDVEAEEKN